MDLSGMKSFLAGVCSPFLGVSFLGVSFAGTPFTGGSLVGMLLGDTFCDQLCFVEIVPVGGPLSCWDGCSGL